MATQRKTHTNGTRPGNPTPRAMVADNDLALGRVVEAVSRSKFWPKTCILVTEDDPQSGFDHVDGHRTVLSGRERYWAEKSVALAFEKEDEADEDTLNRILWHAVRGDAPYPDDQ